MRSVRLAVLLCSMLVCVLLAELLVRYVLPVDPGRLLPLPYNSDRVRTIARGDTFITYDAEIGWNLTPSRTRRSDGAVFRINSQSIRSDHDYPHDSPPGVRRYVAVGDSFTHCSEVTQGDCWTVQLEETVPNTEVLNFGVPGYGPDQALLRYRRDGRQFGGCAALMGYFVGDIERTVNRFRPFIHPDDSVVLGKPRFLLEGDSLRLLPNPVTDLGLLHDPHWVEATLGPSDAWYFPNTFVAGPFDSSRLVQLARTAAYHRARQALLRTPTGYPLYDQESEAYHLTRRILLQFVEDVRADGASPVIVVMPGNLDLQLVSAGINPYARLIDQLRDAGAPVIDVTPDLLNELTRRSLDDLFEDQHYSKRGNAVVAQTLARDLPGLTHATCEPDRGQAATGRESGAPAARPDPTPGHPG